MGSKPRVKREKRVFDPKNFDPCNLSKDDLKEICAEMAVLIRLMVQFGKLPTGFTFSMDTGELGTLEERSFNVLDSIGQVVDRDAYYAQKAKKTRKR